MKKHTWAALLLAGAMTFSMTACGSKADTPNIPDEDSIPTGDYCPGNALGPDGTDMVPAEGFDPNEDMSFTTTDVDGNPVTNEIFSGTDRGVWVVFWRTDSDKSGAELSKLDGLTDEAAEHGYKILGIVMDGQENREQAAEMAGGLSFDNIVWNDSVALRFDGVEDFFTEVYFEENKDQFESLPGVKDPVSTRTNSRGQIQTACTLLPIGEDKLVQIWQNNDSNATYEEVMAESQKILEGN